MNDTAITPQTTLSNAGVPHADRLEASGIEQVADLFAIGVLDAEGKIDAIDILRDVDGIGPARLDKIRAFLREMKIEDPDSATPSNQMPPDSPPDEPDSAPPDQPGPGAPEPDEPPKQQARPGARRGATHQQSHKSVSFTDPGIDLDRLADFFEPTEIEWRPDNVSKNKFDASSGTSYAMALAYVTNRAMQQRLDDVCGPHRWRNEYAKGPDGGVICGISIYLKMPDGSYQWITKWDGAENTNYSPIKGGLSDAMKRAAYQWGIGRYLYKLPTMWLKCNAYKQGKGIRFSSWIEKPELPPNFIPKAQGQKTRRDHPERRKAEKAFHATGTEYYGAEKWNEKARDFVVSAYAREKGFPAVESMQDLTTRDLKELSARMRKAINQRKEQKPPQPNDVPGGPNMDSGPEEMQDFEDIYEY